MDGRFEVQPYRSTDKDITILGRGVTITVDYDDVDRRLVECRVRQIVTILNWFWWNHEEV